MMATREPIKVFNVNFSFKNNAAKKPVKIGAVASIKADVVESAVCNPLKKDHWFIKTPTTPRNIMANKSDLFTHV